MRKPRALVFGGTGYVGSAVVERLRDEGVPVAFTYLDSYERAVELSRGPDVEAHRVDLREPDSIVALLDTLQEDGRLPDVFVHCATRGDWRGLADVTLDEWRDMQAVNVESAFVAAKELGGRLRDESKGGDIVFTTAMTGVMAVPAPVHFGASQGALIGMMRSLANELGGDGIRVNAVTLGVLDGGISEQLTADLKEDFERFSSLRRIGNAEEAARVIVWLALQNNSISGSTLTANGGL